MKNLINHQSSFSLVRPAPQLVRVERDLVNEKIYVQLSDALQRGDFKAGQSIKKMTNVPSSPLPISERKV